VFELICEGEPPTRPDLKKVRHQIGVMSPIADGFLIPDNHIGRATVSSIAVAHEADLMGGRAIACLNARDRNVLGFRRDLLTAAAYGVRDFLFVYGDRPETGARSDDLTVRRMLEEARAFSAQQGSDGLHLAVTTRPTAMPAWKLEADALFVQVSHDLDALVQWRSSISFDGPVYAGVIVFGSAAMARKLSADVPQLAAPPTTIEALERDPSAGVRLAVETVLAIRESGAFAGAHLIPVRKYRELASALEERLCLRGQTGRSRSC
jgi:5,10-methylenetetrahydrofolate reductase